MIHAREDYNRIQDPDDKIPEHEPVFLIRGQDAAAIPALNAWIAAATELGASPDIIKRVQDHVMAIREWQEWRKVKVPDL